MPAPPSSSQKAANQASMNAAKAKSGATQSSMTSKAANKNTSTGGGGGGGGAAAKASLQTQRGGITDANRGGSVASTDDFRAPANPSVTGETQKSSVMREAERRFNAQTLADQLSQYRSPTPAPLLSERIAPRRTLESFTGPNLVETNLIKGGNIPAAPPSTAPAGQKVTDIFGPTVDLDPQIAGRLAAALAKSRAPATGVPAGQKVSAVMTRDPVALDPAITGQNQTALSDRTYGMADIKINDDGSISMVKDQSRLPGMESPRFDTRTGQDLTAAITGEKAPKAYGDDPYAMDNLTANPQTSLANGLPNIASSVKTTKQFTDRVPAQSDPAAELASRINEWRQNQIANNAIHRGVQPATGQSSVLDHIFGGKPQPSGTAVVSPTGVNEQGPIPGGAPINIDPAYQRKQAEITQQLNLQRLMDTANPDAPPVQDLYSSTGKTKIETLLTKLFGGSGNGKPPIFGPGGDGGNRDRRKRRRSQMGDLMSSMFGVDVSGMDREALLALMQTFLNPDQTQVAA